MSKETYILNLEKIRKKIMSNFLITIFLFLILLYFISTLKVEFTIKYIYFVVLILASLFVLQGKLNLLFTDKVIFDDKSLTIVKFNKEHKFDYNTIKFIIRNEINGKNKINFYYNSKLILALDMQNLSKEIFNEFVEFIAKFTILNQEIISKSTYGELLNLVYDENLSDNNPNLNYIVKKDFYQKYGFLVFVFVLFIAIITLILSK